MADAAGLSSHLIFFIVTDNYCFLKRVHHVMSHQFSREAVERREFALLVDVFAQHSAGQGVVSLRSHAERTQL